MCGIAAIWYRDDEGGPAGADLLRMLTALSHRGRDGSGVAIYDVPGAPPRVMKHAATPADLEAERSFSGLSGGHGIGHVRMATETAVDADHAHPFLARMRPDLALVHNGHVTNADALRERFARHGLAFETDNDSEVIAAYVAAGLADGEPLEEVLARSVHELDGTFSYVVATADALGAARDRFAAKPLVVAETGDWVAVTSEGRGLPEESGWRRREARAGEVCVWRR